MKKPNHKLSKSYRLCIKIFETATEIARVSGVTPQAVSKWKKTGVPRKRRQVILDAAGGKIESIDELRG